MRSGVKDRKPPYAEPLVRWCERSVNTKVGDKHLRLVFTSYSIPLSPFLSLVPVCRTEKADLEVCRRVFARPGRLPSCLSQDGKPASQSRTGPAERVASADRDRASSGPVHTDSRPKDDCPLAGTSV